MSKKDNVQSCSSILGGLETTFKILKTILLAPMHIFLRENFEMELYIFNPKNLLEKAKMFPDAKIRPKKRIFFSANYSLFKT